MVIHGAAHGARPDVVAAANAHGPYGKTLPSRDLTIEPLTRDARAECDDVGVRADDCGTVVYSEGGRATDACGTHKAVIVATTACLTPDAPSTVPPGGPLERTCQCSPDVRRGGSSSQPLRTTTRLAGTGQVGCQLPGWFQFRPIGERISEDNTDMSD